MRHLLLWTSLTVSLVAGCESGPPGGDGGRVDGGGVDGGGSDGGTLGGTDGGGGGGSLGCGMASTLATGEWVSQSLTVEGTDRSYFVFLPDGYDAERAYPIIYQLHGCSDSATREDNNVPVQREVGGEAIVVRGRAAANCWDTAEDGPDVPYFDAMLEAVESDFCVDPEHRFLTGYSSGGFMSHRLACIRGDMLRGIATIAGAQGGSGCAGNVAALLIHDRDDGTVNISASEGARDNHAMRNGCDTEAARTPTDDPPCEAYTGCDTGLPVVWCETSGENHSRQDALAAPIFWSFLSSL